MIHPLADVHTIKIGDGTTVWQFSIILKNAVIGKNCNINCHTFVENDVVIGNNVTVKPGVYLWDGITVEDNVFIGPNVTFANDKFPRSKKYPEFFQRTILKYGASIGAGAIILGGISIGAYSMIGAGSVITKNTPDRSLVVGNPSKITGWLNEDGSKMVEKDDYFIDKNGECWKFKNNELIKL